MKHCFQRSILARKPGDLISAETISSSKISSSVENGLSIQELAFDGQLRSEMAVQWIDQIRAEKC